MRSEQQQEAGSVVNVFCAKLCFEQVPAVWLRPDRKRVGAPLPQDLRVHLRSCPRFRLGMTTIHSLDRSTVSPPSPSSSNPPSHSRWTTFTVEVTLARPSRSCFCASAGKWAPPPPSSPLRCFSCFESQRPGSCLDPPVLCCYCVVVEQLFGSSHRSPISALLRPTEHTLPVILQHPVFLRAERSH